MESQLRSEVQETIREGGKRTLIERWLREPEAEKSRVLSGYERAVWMAWNGDSNNALEELEYAEQARPFNLIYLAAEPVFRWLRDEPRFQGLIARLALAGE